MILQHDGNREQCNEKRDRWEEKPPITQVAEEVPEEVWDADLLHGAVLSVEVESVLDASVEVELEVSVDVESAGPLGDAPAVIP